MKKRIIISGGGTLGHILPIIPVVKEIYKEYDLYFVGTKKGLEKKYIESNDLLKYFKKVYYFDMQGINRKQLLKNIKLLYKYYIIRKRLKKLYKNINPSLVIGMGGYISGVAINVAAGMKIKTIIHEQNKIMGLANKLVYKKVDKILLAYDIENINNKEIVGNPRFSYVKDNFTVKDENIILIVGGSLGSEFINNSIINNLDKFKIKDYVIKLIVGKKYYESNYGIINKINEENIFIQIYPFLDNLVEEMSRASIVISRGGATTISEIIALRKPSILIPSPNVTNNHQYYNVLDLYEKKCCEMIEEKNFDIDKIKEIIIHIITNYKYKTNIITNLDKYYNFDPKTRFIEIIKEEIC